MTGRAWPWRDSDVVRVSLTGLLGVAAIGGAWFGASGSSSPTVQSTWLNVAVAGLVVSGVGVGWWLQRGRQAVGYRRSALVALDHPVPEPADRSLSPAPRPWHATASFALVRAPGMRRVHDPACPLMAGKDMEPTTLDGGEPCAVCA